MLAGLTTSDWLNIGGGAIAVIGFAVTLLQLARVKKALDRHVTRSAGEMLAFSIAQLERFERPTREPFCRTLYRRMPTMICA